MFQFVANQLIPDHDAGVFNPPLVDQHQFTIADKVVVSLLGGFRRWDAVYFLHLAQHGYTFENCVAFFPLYPVLVSTIRVAGVLCPCLSVSSLLLISGVVVNVVLFVVAAVVLLRLGYAVTQDSRLSYLAAVLFCINPASIFMTAPYTETLFACLSFGGMLCIRQQKLLMGTILIGASALTRSNGVVSFGFIIHYLVADYVRYVIFANRIHRKSVLMLIVRMVQKAIVIASKAVIFLLISLAPFALYQWYIYDLFCFPDNQNTQDLPQTVINYGRKEGLKLVGQGPVSSWCFNSVPLSYSYVQSHYWRVGFMKYYQLKQIPNFILAGPIIALSLCACCSFYCLRPDACHRLGLVDADKYKVETVGSCREERRNGWYSAGLVVYLLHLLFLTAFGCCFMHIQVMTRFLCSASPVVYWFAAYMVREQTAETASGVDPCPQPDKYTFLHLLTLHKRCSPQGKLVVYFFWGYFVVGTVAFSNFLPWT
ncbi:hypothetical protein ACOMHN_058551 [Nucella lapillus]